jgi:hypothetical protein
MYLFDPDRGRARRARLRNQCLRAARDTETFLDKAGRDLSNRVQGTLAELESLFDTRPVSDRVLVERVRSKLGRCIAHPHAVEVSSHAGNVVLCGRVLSHEVQDLVSTIRSVRGVMHVSNQLEVHTPEEQVTGLRGDDRSAHPSGIRAGDWPPAVKLLAGTLAGLTLLRAGAASRRVRLLGLLGAGLVGWRASGCGSGACNPADRRSTSEESPRWADEPMVL